VIPITNVLDIGAHKGSFSKWAQVYFRPEKIWMVEADPELAAKLKEQFEEDSGVSVIHGAIADACGDIELRINQHRDSSSILPLNDDVSKVFNAPLKELRTVSVPGYSLDAFFEQHAIRGVDLMKSDIQGAEKLLIAGGKKALKRVKVLVLEVLFQEQYHGCALFHELDTLLQDVGFKLRYFPEMRVGRNQALAYADAVYVNLKGCDF